MYQHDLKIQKGLKNKVQIQIKNSDQKRINVTTGTFVFSMFNALDQRLLVKKNLTILDEGTTATRGLALLELTESDTLDLPTGQYQFTVASLGSDNSYEPTYANTYYGVNGTLELREDAFPRLQPSDVVTDREFEGGITYNRDYGAMQYEFYSGWFNAHPEFNGNSAQHTMAFYLNNFKGTIKIQGTMVNSPQQYGAAVTIETIDVAHNTTGVIYKNFYGVWSNVRIIHIPAKSGAYGDNNYLGIGNPLNPTNTVPFYPNGKLDKALYRS